MVLRAFIYVFKTGLSEQNFFLHRPKYFYLWYCTSTGATFVSMRPGI
uniref:Uncharacterized protein n=1 Tax=Anguilla anguilla TaxID=7936 RepID=A0A0E9PCM6_ANGAN